MSKLCLNRKNTQDILQSLRCSNLFFLFFSIFSHGLQFPQGPYPSIINSSRLPVNSFLFFAFIFATLLHSGLWNFLVFVLMIYSASSACIPSVVSVPESAISAIASILPATASPASTQLSPVS